MMNRFARILLSAVVLPISGCSFVLVQGPPSRGAAGSCTVDSGVPALDVGFGVVEVLGGVGHYFEPLTVTEDPAASPGDSLFAKEKAIGPWLSGVLVGSGVLHLLAAREGSRRIAECNAWLRFGLREQLRMTDLTTRDRGMAYPKTKLQLESGL